MSNPKHCLILTHGQPEPGRERAALALQGRFLAFMLEIEASGRAETRAYLLLTGGQSSRKGVVVLEGERAAIDEIFWSKEWKSLVAQATALTRDVQLDVAVGGKPQSLAGPSTAYASFIEALEPE